MLLVGPATACADGSEDVIFGENVVGCDGAWSGGGIAGGGSLCAEGWHVCTGLDEVLAGGATSCDAAPAGTFYATLESSTGQIDCDDDGTNGTGVGQAEIRVTDA